MVELFGNNDAYAKSPYTTDYVTNITVTNLCEIYGNVNSLLDEDDFGEITTIPAPYAFGGLFGAAWFGVGFVCRSGNKCGA